MSTTELLQDLQAWYAAQTNGDWEHEYGIRIESLDNPGWFVMIELSGTFLARKPFEHVERKSSETDWIDCDVVAEAFTGAGGPHNLAELLQVFLDWAKREPDWLAVPPSPTQADLDRAFLERLAQMGHPAAAEACRHAECTNARIRNSVFCATHHFEMLRGYLPPE